MWLKFWRALIVHSRFSDEEHHHASTCGRATYGAGSNRSRMRGCGASGKGGVAAFMVDAVTEPNLDGLRAALAVLLRQGSVGSLVAGITLFQRPANGPLRPVQCL
jgi:hypothetical protein